MSTRSSHHFVHRSSSEIKNDRQKIDKCTTERTTELHYLYQSQTVGLVRTTERTSVNQCLINISCQLICCCSYFIIFCNCILVAEMRVAAFMFPSLLYIRDLRISRLRSNRIRIESGVTIRIRIESAVYAIS